MQDRGIGKANVARIKIFLKMYGMHGAVAPGSICNNSNTLNFCDDFLSIVNFKALLLLNGSR